MQIDGFNLPLKPPTETNKKGHRAEPGAPDALYIYIMQSAKSSWAIRQRLYIFFLLNLFPFPTTSHSAPDILCETYSLPPFPLFIGIQKKNLNKIFVMLLQKLYNKNIPPEVPYKSMQKLTPSLYPPRASSSIDNNRKKSRYMKYHRPFFLSNH